MSLRIILVTHQRPYLFAKAVDSLLRAIQNAEGLDATLFIGVQGAIESQIFAADLIRFQKHTQIRIQIHAKSETPPEIRNQLMKDSLEKWFFFCDDDVEVPEHIFVFFQKLIESERNVKVMGGPNLTFPTAPPDEIWQGRFLASRFLNPVFYPRYSLRSQRRTQSNRFYCLCNLFVKNEVGVVFRHLHFCGEELQLLSDLRFKNANWIYSPNLAVYHHRRKSLEQFLSQLNYYGRGRGVYLRNNFSGALQRLILSGAQILRLLVRLTPRSYRYFRCLESYLSGLEQGLDSFVLQDQAKHAVIIESSSN